MFCMGSVSYCRVLIKNVTLPTCYRSNLVPLNVGLINSIHSGTLKKEICKYQSIFTSYDNTESSVSLKIFYTYLSESLRGFYTIADIFAVHFLDMDKVFLSGQKREHSCHLLMFHLVKEVLFFRHAIIPFSLVQELYAPHHVRPITKVLVNNTSDCGLMMLSFPSESSHHS